MNIRKIIREEMDDLQWIRDIEPDGIHFMLNKAFYFDRDREDFDDETYAGYYNKLTTRLINLGFKSEYSSPIEADPFDFNTTGLYAYRDLGGDLVFVYTSYDSDIETMEDYEEHIKEFGLSKSEDEGENIEVVDAIDFVIDFVETYL
jgi:hypothetical protein